MNTKNDKKLTTVKLSKLSGVKTTWVALVFSGVLAGHLHGQASGGKGFESPADGHRKARAALAELKMGNHRFITGLAAHPQQDSKTRKELAKGQKPHSIIFSCSDSRVGPEIVFDQGLGQVFSVRTAGQSVASPELASIEYAVEHLGSRLIVVMGHTSCGAVKAALTVPAGQSAGSPHLDALVSGISRKINTQVAERAIASAVKDDPTFRVPVEANAHAVAAELKERSKIIRDYVSKHGLTIVEAVYDLDSGKVDFRGEAQNLDRQSIETESAKPVTPSAHEHSSTDQKHSGDSSHSH
jgi:carbonic anhydrase